jgi:serine/threonine-protein kinase HipA
MITTAFINIWDKRVGAIAWDADTELGTFEFERDFPGHNWDISPLKMPIREAERRIFYFHGLTGTTTFKGLPGLLADSLPDKYGNILIKTWLARQGRLADSMNPVETLCFIGKRGMGALEFEPATPDGTTATTKIEIDSLVDIAGKILSGRTQFETNLAKNEEKALMDIFRIGTSAGGARAKAVIAYNQKTGETRSGQAEAPKDFTHWLIKFDGIEDKNGIEDSQLTSSKGFGRIEMAYHLMAVDCEIEMMECRLLEENGRAHFMTRQRQAPCAKFLRDTAL